MVTKKGGTILINKNTRLVALVYRARLGDLSFPKGHLEDGESLIDCAIRETIEETGRDCHLVNDDVLGVIKYVTPSGECVENYMYLAIDDGKHKGVSPDPEVCVWVDLDEVMGALSYDNLKIFWKEVYPKIKSML